MNAEKVMLAGWTGASGINEVRYDNVKVYQLKQNAKRISETPLMQAIEYLHHLQEDFRC